ncbi:hypothetical protein GCM10027423_19500 [Spirosoma arcticum]
MCRGELQGQTDRPEQTLEGSPYLRLTRGRGVSRCTEHTILSEEGRYLGGIRAIEGCAVGIQKLLDGPLLCWYIRFGYGLVILAGHGNWNKDYQ